jgi:hypothetical protein
MTAALTHVWQIILDQKRPIWHRTEVLVGVGVGAVALLAWAGRKRAKPRCPALRHSTRLPANGVHSPA